MPYSSAFQDSLRKLATTRNNRKNQEIPRLSYQEREDLLSKYHPDFRAQVMVQLKIGPNKGQKVPKELAALLHSSSRLNLKNIGLQKADYQVDVLVIGGGGAGVTAALSAQEKKADVLLASKLRIGDANTTMAEGGMAAALKEADPPDVHFIDQIGGGHFFNDPDLVKTMVKDAPQIIDWFIDLGVLFDRESNGELKVSAAGGHSRKRIISCKDYTGLEIMRVLKDEIKNKKIPMLEFSPAVELLLDKQGSCAGAVLCNLDTDEYIIVRAKSVILTTGGIGRLHIQQFPTTNHYGATADGLIMAYRAGAKILHMDSIQYHPTGVSWPEQLLGQLITEGMRGHGAQLVNAQGERFINELECRDTTASAIIRECTNRKNGIRTPTGMDGVWLDTPLIPGVEKHFIGIYQRFSKYGIDITKEPILVFPTQHYQNGGLKINRDGETQVNGLFAAGEVAGGVQGKNRLGGNSLSDIFVFGRRAGCKAAEMALEKDHGRNVHLNHVSQYESRLKELDLNGEEKSPLLIPDYIRPETKARKYY